MCGIIYARSDTPVREKLWKCYTKQKDRGQDGYGLVAFGKDGGINAIARTQTEKEMEKTLGEIVSNEILFHHRYPTSTPNIPSQTHPILVENNVLKNKYYVVHNGVISNDTELKAKHEKLGIKYTTEIRVKTTIEDGAGCTYSLGEKTEWNDSEAFAVELALFLENKVPDLDGVSGSIAFVCVEINANGEHVKLHYGRNYRSPLLLDNKLDEFVLSSDGSGKQVDSDTLNTYDYQTGEITTKKVDIGKGYSYQTTYCGQKYLGFNTKSGKEDSDEVVVETEDGLYNKYDELEAELEQLKSEYDWTKAEYAKNHDGESMKGYFKADMKKQKKEIKKLERELEVLEWKIQDSYNPY